MLNYTLPSTLSPIAPKVPQGPHNFSKLLSKLLLFSPEALEPSSAGFNPLAKSLGKDSVQAFFSLVDSSSPLASERIGPILRSVLNSAGGKSSINWHNDGLLNVRLSSVGYTDQVHISSLTSENGENSRILSCLPPDQTCHLGPLCAQEHGQRDWTAYLQLWMLWRLPVLGPSILGTAINLLPVLLGRGNLTGKMRMLSLSPSMFSPIYSPGGPRLPGIHGKLD